MTFSPHYLFRQEDNSSFERQIFIPVGKIQMCVSLIWLSRYIPYFALCLPPCSLCLHPILSITECGRRCSGVRSWACLGPGWWVRVVIVWCSLLIWYSGWLRSLIRDSGSQRETRLSITSRIPPARAKRDGGKERGRRWRSGERIKVKEKRLQVYQHQNSMGQWRGEWEQKTQLLLFSKLVYL